MTAKTFGRRASAAPAPLRRETRAPAPVAPVSAPPPVSAPVAAEPAETPVVADAAPAAELSVDEELRRWKEERRQTLFYRLPWRQFSLFASISFGVASFVLPDSVNDSVDYLLWGLSLISFAIWIGGFRKPAAGASTGK